MIAAPRTRAEPGLREISHALVRGRRRRLPTAVLTVSILGLRLVRAVHGRAGAHAVRTEVRARLAGLAEELAGVTVVATGPDDFAVVCPGHHEEDARLVADRVLDLVAAPTSARPALLGAAAGLVVSEGSEGSADDLMRDAETALTWAAERGPATVAVFRPAMREALADRLRTAVDLGSALARDGELFLHYQPVVDLVTHSVVGAEALVRWRHPDRGLVSPGAFIPVAEETGLITDLGRWVLDAAVAQLGQWQSLTGDGFRLHVNLSPVEMRQPRIVGQVADTLARYDVAPSRLLLEITETGVMTGDGEPVARLEELRRTGVSLGIDDFGTGYSSVSYLRELPIDVVKLDRSLTSMVAASPHEYALTRAIFGLTRSSGLDIVAEGIEEHVQVAHLRAMRCRYGQGFLLGRPDDPQRVTEMLATR